MNDISLVISDVDGTLLTHDKRLTASAINAVARLAERNIGFTLTSSRPPFGMRMLVAPLKLKLPFGAFNGGLIVNPDFTLVQQTLIPPDVARTALEALRASGVDAWLFTDDRWLITRKDGSYVAHEQKTILVDPVIVPSLSEFADRACKIVGVSADPDELTRCESIVQAALGVRATIVRSQNYYLDITPSGRDKGTFVEAMAERLRVPRDRIATLGDMQNDLPMFRKSGLSFAMGNATDDVKAQATAITDTNDDDGFAKAIDRILTGEIAS